MFEVRRNSEVSVETTL